MTTKEALQLNETSDTIEISHNPETGYSVISGTIDGKAFYQAIDKRVFDCLLRKRIIARNCNEKENYFSQGYHFTI